MNKISKNNIVFLDTNILSDIGRFDETIIRSIVLKIAVQMKLLIAVTPFNILEIEKIPDEEVKKRICFFLNLSNVIFMKGMDELFAHEIISYQKAIAVEPNQFITTFTKKTNDGRPFNFLSVLNNLLSNVNYKKALAEHYDILDKLQERFKQKLRVSEDEFAKTLFRKHLLKTHPDVEIGDWRKLSDCCPSYMSYAYSLYDKIGSKGLKKKVGELNDTAMSYIFPYVKIVVTEKRQASVFNRVKAGGKIPALNDTIILKYSDVFKNGEFQLQEALEIKEK